MAIIQRIRTVFTGVAGAPWYSNLYVTATEGDAQPEVDAVAQFWTDFATHIHNAVDWTVEGVVANIDETNGQIVGFSTNDDATGSGAAGSDPLPYANQMLLRVRTGVFVAGREVRGHVNIPAITDPDSPNGVPSSSASSNLQTSSDDNLFGAGGLNGALLVWSRKNGQAHPASSSSVAPFFAVLRSRRD